MTETTTSERALAPFRGMRDLLEPYPAARYIHLLPTTAQERSDLYRPAITVVQINPDDAREVYDTPGGGGTVCLHSTALERIANAAGIDFDPTFTHHVHDRMREPFVCETHVGGWYTDSLGQRRPITAGAVSDLRDGTPTAKVLTGRTGKGLETARQFICERTESRARNRAIRKTTNLPSSFTKDELRKPMVAVRFRLDERDPEARRALIAQGTRATTEVFGSAGPAIDAGVARPDEEIIEGQVIETPAAATEPAIPDEPKTPAATPESLIADVQAAAAEAAATDGDGLATNEQLVALGTELIQVLGLSGKLGPEERVALRLTFLRAFLGADLPGSSHARAAMVSVLLRMLRDPDGQKRIRLIAESKKVGATQ